MTDKELEDIFQTITIDLSNNVDQTIISDLISTSAISDSFVDTITISSGNDSISFDWFSNWELEKEWVEINKVAEGNEALKKAIERVKILYYLSKDD